MEQRSQPLLRLPKNQTPAQITLHDGHEAQVFLFVPPGGSLAHYVVEHSHFVPIGFADGTRLVARAALATISIHAVHAPVEDELPGERQYALITLRSGRSIRGELRWVAPEGQRRTLDLLNGEASYLAVHTNEHVTYVFKSHIASVEEIPC